MAETSSRAVRDRAATSKPGIGRKRGRPPKTIGREALVDAIQQLLVEGGIDAVSIDETAKRLSVSRATLYRTVPSKGDLLGLLFEELTNDLDVAVREVLESAYASPIGKLDALVRVHVHSCLRMREYVAVFWGGISLPIDVEERWHTWRKAYEATWEETVSECIEVGELRAEDPTIATRLIFGMTIWISRWYRADEDMTERQIADHVMRMVHSGA
ncbi:MAG: hypothetical protein QOG62_266 [Thermoleophilaceae bacterium]|nr:hypothetical protein [Thermoleophilaceae bacterium]